MKKVAAGAAAIWTMLVVMPLDATAQSPVAVERSGNVFNKRVCDDPRVPDVARCHARVVTDSLGTILARGSATPLAAPAGLGAGSLRTAYGVTPVAGPFAAPTAASPIIAVVAAYGYGKAEGDLATYRTQFGLPPCRSNATNPAQGCFVKYNQTGSTSGLPKQNTGWAQEQALDLQMASAMCPSCRLILVEAKSANDYDLAAAHSTAARKIREAFGTGTPLGAINNSYGIPESANITPGLEANFNQPGIPVVASSGDKGYGVSWPSSLPTVVAVGGTTLTAAANPRGYTETAWSGAGSGCSTRYAKPAWQTDGGCAMRTVADLSAVADPATGVAVYGPIFGTLSGWMVFGGTSVASPIVAGLYGANGAVSQADPGADIWGAPVGTLNDVVSGSNGSCPLINGLPNPGYLCTAGTGYDGPTGFGTPKGSAAPF
jgi:hypothetical protein